MTVPAEILRCVQCGSRLSPENATTWACERRHVFPVVDGVVRLLPGETLSRTRTAETFGFQWTTFDVSDQAEDAAVFHEKTGLSVGDLAGKLVLDAGCGGGRYARLAGSAGARVVAMDLSDAVTHARRLTASLPDVLVVQANLMDPPLAPESFDIVYSIGVLHHTPDTQRAFRSVARLVKPGGYLAVWLYRRNTILQEAVNSSVRAVTTRLPVPAVLMLARAGAVLGGVPGLRHVNKIVNFSAHPRWTTRVCDTFDWYAPPYQHHHTESELMEWFRDAGFTDLRALHPGRARTGWYGAIYRHNLLIGSGVNVAGRKV